MPTQMISDLLVDLSTEQQQLLAGGQNEEEEIESDESEDDESEDESPSFPRKRFSSFPSRRKRYVIRGIFSVRRLPF